MPQPPLTFVGRRATLWALASALALALALGGAALAASAPRWPSPAGAVPLLLAGALALLLVQVLRGRLTPAAAQRAAVVLLALHALQTCAQQWARGPAAVDLAALALLTAGLPVLEFLIFLALPNRRALGLTLALATATAAMPWLVGGWGAASAAERQGAAGALRLALAGGALQLLCAGVGYAVARQVAQLAAGAATVTAARGTAPWSVQQLVSRGEQERRRLREEAAHAARNASTKDAELRTLWDVFPGLLWRLDADGRVSHANAAVAALLGVDRDGVVGRHARELLGDAGWHQCPTHSAGAAAAPAPAVTFEAALTRGDGSRCELLVTQFGVAGADGSAPVSYQLGVDIGARKAAERALAAAKADAERANLAKSRYLSRFSHELRTPLNAVLGLAQLLRVPSATAGPAQHRLHLRTIAEAGRELLALVDQTMDLSRLEAGEMRVACQPVALLDVVQGAWETVAPMASAHGVHLAPLPLPRTLWVHADPVRLRQVLLNLLTNAVKYNRPGGGVALRLARRGAAVRLSVHDTGCGMTPAQQARLFEPFERLGAEDSEVAGSGVGLSIARGLATLMGGRLELKSEVGVGSEFMLWLALAAAPPAGDAAAASSDFGPLHDDTSVAGDVFYVEDDEVNVLVLQAVLARRPGVHLTVARDKRQALSLARGREAPPALLLLDLNLPDGCGLALAARLRALPGWADVPAVLLTADATPQAAARARDAGVDRVWLKPFDAARLLREVDALLETSTA